nr:MAG TPA: hypothetical protein [Caudoviricetes sp.]
MSIFFRIVHFYTPFLRNILILLRKSVIMRLTKITK